MSRSRRLRLGAFMRPVTIHTGGWRYPGAWPDANFNFAHLRHLAQRLEAAKFDAFFMADHLARPPRPSTRPTTSPAASPRSTT